MKIIAVTNDRLSIQSLTTRLLAIESDIDFVILRERSKSDQELYQLIQSLINAQFDQDKIIIHQRVDLALLTGITRVQIPGNGFSIKDLKGTFSTLLFGASIHSSKEAKEALEKGADWLLYGHVFETASKQGIPPRGVDELFQIAKDIPLPIYAIGGIKNDHMEWLKKHKVSGVAMLSNFFKEDYIL